MSLPAPAVEITEAPVADTPELTEIVSGDLLVEEVSIDGMCGVY
jgi:mycofactocin precursor